MLIQVKISIKTLLLFLVLGLFSCAGSPPHNNLPVENRRAGGITGYAPEAEIAANDNNGDAAPLRTYLSIVAVGDNLIHHPIFEASYADGRYDFHYIFDHIREYILPADIAFINQETVLGNEELGFSGWPLFSSPPEIGTAIAAAGFNVINHTNNHTLDRGAEGVMSSIEYWDNYNDVYYLGIHRSEEERRNRQVIISMNDITVGFLGYTYGLNGIPLPAGRPYLVSLIDRSTIAAEVRALRPHCDYLVVSMHWGNEYAFNFNREQEELAAFLAELEVDLVIGHHPHVLQPMQIVIRPDGRPMPVFYSLGNFLSSHANTTKEALLGGIMYVRISKDAEEVSIEEIGLIPIITHFDAARLNFGIYPLHEYTGELAARHWRRRNDPEMTPEFFMNAAREMFASTLIHGNVFGQR